MSVALHSYVRACKRENMPSKISTFSLFMLCNATVEVVSFHCLVIVMTYDYNSLDWKFVYLGRMIFINKLLLAS